MATAAQDFTGMEEGQIESQPLDSGGINDVSTDVGQDGSDAGGGQEASQVDGRKGPLNIRSATKAIAEALNDPMGELAAKFPGSEKAAKELGAAYFRANAYAEVFPKVEDAQAAKTFIDTVGGIDGFGEIQQRIQGYDAQEAGLESGDPAVLDSFFQDYPEGAAQLAPHYLDRLAKANPEAFQTTIAPHALGMLERAGIMGHVASMAAETDPNRQKAMIGQLDAWLKEQGQNIAKLKTAAPPNPLEGKLKEREAGIQKQEDEFFGRQVDTGVNTKVSPELGKVVEQYAKSYKLNDTQKARFASAVAQRTVNDMLADETFKKQDDIRRSSKTRNADSVAGFRSSEFLRRLPDVAFKEAQELWGANKNAAQPTGVVKPGQPKTAPGGGPLMISRAPDVSELDMARDPRQLMYISNKGYRKSDGMYVTWK